MCLKLKVTVLQHVFIAERTFTKFVLLQVGAKYTMLIEPLRKKALFCSSAIRTFLIPGKRFPALTLAILFSFQKSSSKHLTALKACNILRFLRSAALPSWK